MDWQQARLAVEHEWNAQDQRIRTGRVATGLQDLAKLIAAIRCPGSSDASVLLRQVRDAVRLKEAIRNDLPHATDRAAHERHYDDLAQQLHQIVVARPPPVA